MDMVTLVGFGRWYALTRCVYSRQPNKPGTRSHRGCIVGDVVEPSRSVCFFLLVYGLLLGALPIILANLITLVLTLAILVLNFVTVLSLFPILMPEVCLEGLRISLRSSIPFDKIGHPLLQSLPRFQDTLGQGKRV